MNKQRTNNENKKKGFFSKVFESLDRKIAEKSKEKSACCGTDKGKGSSCC